MGVLYSTHKESHNTHCTRKFLLCEILEIMKILFMTLKLLGCGMQKCTIYKNVTCEILKK